MENKKPITETTYELANVLMEIKHLEKEYETGVPLFVLIQNIKQKYNMNDSYVYGLIHKLRSKGLIYESQKDYIKKCDLNMNHTILEKPLSRNDKEVNIWKSYILERDKVCQCCGGDKYLEVHHINSWKDYPSLRIDKENGIVLCKWCHNKYNSYYGHKGTARSLMKFLYDEWCNGRFPVIK